MSKRRTPAQLFDAVHEGLEGEADNDTAFEGLFAAREMRLRLEKAEAVVEAAWEEVGRRGLPDEHYLVRALTALGRAVMGSEREGSHGE